MQSDEEMSVVPVRTRSGRATLPTVKAKLALLNAKHVHARKTKGKLVRTEDHFDLMCGCNFVGVFFNLLLQNFLAVSLLALYVRDFAYIVIS